MVSNTFTISVLLTLYTSSQYYLVYSIYIFNCIYQELFYSNLYIIVVDRLKSSWINKKAVLKIIDVTFNTHNKLRYSK